VRRGERVWAARRKKGGEGRGWRAGPACQGSEGRRGWGSGLGSVWAEIQGEVRSSFFSLFFLLLLQNLFQIHFKICLKYFQTLVKITHLKNKMHQHDLHTIVAKPYDKFYFKEKYYSSYIS